MEHLKAEAPGSVALGHWEMPDKMGRSMDATVSISAECSHTGQE